MLAFSLAIIGGFILLIWSADRFVAGAANTALNLGVTPLVIGLTVVGLGTSAPEMIVAAMASFDGNPSMAVGNAIGSNIANIGLILAVTAIVLPINVKAGIATRELPLLMLVTLLAILLIWDQQLSRFDGVLLIGGLALVLFWIVYDAKHHTLTAEDKELEVDSQPKMRTGKAVLLTLFGLILLLISSRVLVWGAVGIAEYFGVSKLVIGLTIIAIGTSLPELAAGIAAAIKHHHELVLGNIIGSNIFNILGVMAVPGLIAPGGLEAEVLSRDIPIMVALTVALFAAAYRFGQLRGRINRLEAVLLLCSYIAYMVYIYVSTVR